MGEWYDYNILFENRKKNIVEEMLKSGFAKFKNEPNHSITLDLLSMENETNRSVVLDLMKMGDKAAIDHYGASEITIGSQTIRYEDGTSDNMLLYCSKWQPNNGLCFCLSRLFPNEMLEVREYAPYYDKDALFYVKNNHFVNKQGIPLAKDEKGTFYMPGVKSKQVRTNHDGSFTVSFPIGSTPNDLWGQINLSKDDCISWNERYHLYFTKETISVKFKHETVEMSTSNFFDKCSDAYLAYKHKMDQTVTIPAEFTHYSLCGQERNQYYVVNIPCPETVSDNRTLSITIPKDNIPNNHALIKIGAFGKTRNARVTKNGEIQTIQLTHGKIKEYFVEQTGYEEPSINERIEAEENTQDEIEL